MKSKTRTTRTALVLLCSAGLLAGVAVAQQDTPPPPPAGQTQGPPPGGGPGGRGGDPERRVEMLQKRLKLSDDQTAQMKTIFDTERSKMEALRDDTSTAPKDKRSQMMAIRQDMDTKVHAMLSPDQAKKFDDLEAQQRERGQGRRGGPSGGATPPPPPSPSSPPPPSLM